MIQRPPNFRLNPKSPLYKGLVFAGLGRAPGGKYMQDSSPRGNRGTLTNMVPKDDWVWVPELGRWAVFFRGTNDYADLGTGASLNVGGGDFTCACWLIHPTLPNAGDKGFLEVSSFAGNEYGITEGYSAGMVGFLTPAPNGIYKDWRYNVGANLNDGAAHHVALVWKSNAATCYVDGLEKSSLSGQIAGSGNNSLGRDSYGYGISRIADPGIWSRALAPSEIKILADRSDPFLGGLILPPRRRLWGAVTAGPAVYEESISLGLTGGITPSAALVMQASVSLDNALSASPTNTADMNASAAFSINAAVQTAANLIAEATITVASQLSATPTAALEAMADIELDAAISIAAQGGVVYELAAELACQLGTDVATAVHLAGAVTLSVQNQVSAQSTAVWDTLLSLGISKSVATSAVGVFESQLTLAVANALAVAASGRTINLIRMVSEMLSQAGMAGESLTQPGLSGESLSQSTLADESLED